MGDGKFSLVGKVMANEEIIGAFIEDNGKERLISINKLYDLAESGLINHWKVIYDNNNNKHLFSTEYKLSELRTLPNVKTCEAEIIYRIVNKNKDTIGYGCKDKNGEQHNYDCNKLWELAKLGLITNAKAGIGKKHKVLEINNGSKEGLKEVISD